MQRKQLYSDVLDRLGDRTYQFNGLLTAGDPTTGKWLLNNANPALATVAHIHKTDLDGEDISILLANLQVGETISSVTSNANGVVPTLGTMHRYTVRGATALVGNYYTVPITYVIYGGTAMSDEDRTILQFRFNAAGAAGGDEFFITKHPLFTGAITWPLNRSYYVSERDCLIGIINEDNSKTRVIKDATLVGATLTGMVAGGGAPSTVTAPILVELYKNSTTLTTIDSANWIMTDWITVVCNSGTGLVETAMLTTDHFSIKCTSPGAWGGTMYATNYNIQLLWKVT